jgi:predicted amidohydrolase
MTNIACVQIDCELGSAAANREKVVERIRAVAKESAELVIFPECSITGYCFDSLEEAAQVAEPLDGPTSEAVTQACRETGVHAIVGFIEREGSAFYNAAMVVGPGGPVCTYRKVHLPYLGVDRFLTPGNRPFEVVALPFGKIGILICYDSSFPEAARALKLLGAELIVLPTNWPPGAWRNPEFVLNTRALENHINFAAASRVGTERGWRFIGRSKVVDFNGDTAGEAGGDDEEILFSQVDFAGANNNRLVNVAGAYEIDRLADRRPEFYGAVTIPSAKSSTAD